MDSRAVVPRQGIVLGGEAGKSAGHLGLRIPHFGAHALALSHSAASAHEASTEPWVRSAPELPKLPDWV